MQRETTVTATQQRIVAEAARLCNEKNIAPTRAVPWAVMRIVEGHDDFPSGGESQGITVGYGYDRQMHESGIYPDDWWQRFPPTEGHRFRVFVPEGDDGPAGHLEQLDYIRRFMSAIGAAELGEFEGDDYDSYEHRGRRSYHFLIGDHEPIHDAVGRQRL